MLDAEHGNAFATAEVRPHSVIQASSCWQDWCWQISWVAWPCTAAGEVPCLSICIDACTECKQAQARRRSHETHWHK